MKPAIGVVYEVLIDENGNQKADPGEDIYIGSTTVPKKRLGCADHPAVDLLADEDCVLVSTPIYVDGPVTPTNGGGDGGPTGDDDPSEGDFPGNSDGGGTLPGGETVRDILEWYEQKRIDEIVEDNGGYEPDGTIPDGPPIVNKKRPMLEERKTELFGGDPPPDTQPGESEVRKFKRVTVAVPDFDPTSGGP